jgi:class 3 adenylate cyclase
MLPTGITAQVPRVREERRRDMQCPQCQQQNPPQAKFCLECGVRLVLLCAQCGTALPAGAKFCLECGQPIDAPPTTASRFTAPEAYTPTHLAEKILTSRSALEGERKQVTVLFADLKGSMELLADRDPEEARQLLDPVLARLMAAVHRYEGTVNQVMGDGIMALFGAPLAHEDHAVRACYAALAMQESIRHYSAEVRRTHGVEVQIRVGLHSGEVVVRAIDNDLHMDYSAIGQTTPLAARMEQLATPGSIRLTAETLRLAEGLIQVTALGPVPVKGLAEPVEVFELVGASALRRRLQVAATRGLTRFVGRQAELAALHQALEQAGAGHGQVVAAVGEAGVGKSRLVYECLHSHRTQGWLVLESASVSYGKATPYGPVLDLLKRYAAVLAARIDRLPPEDKHLLQTAAVIGTEVPWSLLQAIADVPEETLHQGLTRLQSAEFLYEACLFPELSYTFKHALTHEVAYGSLLQERRRVLPSTARAHCRGHRRALCRPPRRPGRTAGAPRRAGRAVGQSPGLLPAGRGAGGVAFGVS